jgi:hypothetical protein
VALLSGVIWIHLHLWQLGYRHIPIVGPLFLVGALSALAVTGVLLARPSRLVGLLALAVDQAILVSLVASINIGLFGFQEFLNGPFVVESIVVEATAGAVLLLWVAVDLAAESGSPRTVVTPSIRRSNSFEHAASSRPRRPKTAGRLRRTPDLPIVSEYHSPDVA